MTPQPEASPDPAKDPAKDPATDAPKDPATNAPKDPATNAPKDQAKDPAKDPAKNPETNQPGRPLTIVMATRRDPAEIGSVERVVVAVVRELARVRPEWRVDIVSAFKAGSRVEGMAGFSDVLAAFRLGRKLRGSTADVVFVHCPEVLWGIRWLRKRPGAPRLIAVWHGAGPVSPPRLRRPGHSLGWALAWLRTTGERYALVADAHVAVHQQVEDCLRSLYGLRAPVSIIDNSLDVTIQDHLARPARDLVRTAVTGLNALWVGQTGYRKGLDVAMAAVAEARADLPGLRLRVVGVPAGKPAEGVEGVDWLGVIPPDRMAEVYRNADLFIFPTRYESSGLVVIEAMAAGLPVIVSDRIGAGIVTHGRNGVVVAGYNPAHYAEALRHLAPAATRSEVAEANIEDVRRFNVDSTVSGYAAVVESFAGSR
jgi:glycosyltransferase involved in cell wall biosynthesis